MASRARRKKRTLGRASALSAAQARALARLSRARVLEGVYLAGGVGIALHLGHRQSIDLDFFSLRPDLDIEALADQMRLVGATTIELTDVTLSVRVGSVPVDIVRYPYRPLGRLEQGPEHVRLASLRDLAVMKLAAIARRGVRRDFWDLYEIVISGATTLRRILSDYSRKYGVSRSDAYHVLRALTWFEDAERDRVMPRGMTSRKWLEIRAWFEAAAAQELRRRSSLRG